MDKFRYSKKKYSQIDHMVQMGRVSALMEASISLNKLILKEKISKKKKLKMRHLKEWGCL